MWQRCGDARLRRAVLMVIAGAIPTSREVPQLLDSAELARPARGDPFPCPHCKAPGDSAEHILWQCSAHRSVRERPEFAGTLAADRSHWSPCLALHGILPTGWSAADAGNLHRLLGSVVNHRLDLDRALLGGSTLARPRPWDVAAKQPALPCRFPYASTPCFHRWRWGLPLYRAYVVYLSRLRWSTASTDCTWLELTIDFELFSGLRITGGVAYDQTKK